MVVPATKKHSSSITKIHIKELPDDFLPSLGFDFLRSLYEGVIEKEGVKGFVDIEKKTIKGFIIGTDDMGKFFKDAMRGNFLKSSYYLLLRLIDKPELIKKILETFLYPKKDQGPKAELVVIAVSRKYQGKGIGKALVNTLEGAFMEKGIIKYKVTVYADKKATFFYDKLEFKRVSAFNLYDKMWYVYEKGLTKKQST